MSRMSEKGVKRAETLLCHLISWEERRNRSFYIAGMFFSPFVFITKIETTDDERDKGAFPLKTSSMVFFLGTGAHFSETVETF
jgi:hypothetical protein